MNEMKEVASVRIVGPNRVENRAPVVSLDFHDQDNAEIAFLLESEYGIATRTGLHCAPNAHKTLGTYPQGTVRFSFGHFNTMDEVLYAANAVKKILNEKAQLTNEM
jgi:selenocysteine lyase/cysteine desulfurase